MATAFAWCISAVVKVAPESEIIRFFINPGPIRVLSGSLGSTKKSNNSRFSSNNGNCNCVVHKCDSQNCNWIGNYSIFFYPGPIRVLSGFYPGVSDRPKNNIISDSVQIMATAIAWCINAVVEVATESEIIRFFFYPGPIRVLSGFYPGPIRESRIDEKII